MNHSANHAEALSRIIEINPYQQNFTEIFKSARSIVHVRFIFILFYFQFQNRIFIKKIFIFQKIRR